MVAIPTFITAASGMLCSLIPGLCTQPGVSELSCTTMPLSPDQQTALGPPTTPLSAVGLGFGVQNYTCSANNVFVCVLFCEVYSFDWLTTICDSSAGAVAELFDISSLASVNSGLVYTIHDTLFDFWNGSQSGNATIQQLIDELSSVAPAGAILAQHYFIENETGGISPVWDFRATPKFGGIADAVLVGKTLANVSDVNPTQNIPWLHVGKVSGDIADEVYRIFTVGGVPPSSVSFLSLTSGILGAFVVDPVDGRAYTFLFQVCQWHDGGYFHQICFSILVLWRLLRFGVQMIS